MKTEYCKKRDQRLEKVAEGLFLIYISASISYTFLVAPILGLKDYSWVALISYGMILAWFAICEHNKYCREAGYMFLSAVFFFTGCIFKAPFWILMKGFSGAFDIFVARLRRFIKLESYRFKKHL